MKTSPLAWDEKLIIKFWDYYSHFPEKYFTYQFGGNIVNTLAKEVKPGSKILDYGCGTGFLIDHFLGKAFDTYGADTSPASVQFVNEKYKNRTAFKGAFLIDDILRLDKRFDAIFIVEVIEHLTDEFLFPLISNVKRMINPGGKIIFTTPNNENLEDSEVYCPVCEHTFHRWQHMRSWSAESLSAVLKTNGLNVINCYGTDFSAAIPDAFLKKVKHRIRNFFFSQPAPHLVAVCSLQTGQ